VELQNLKTIEDLYRADKEANMKIDILLSTYNGEKFIKEQLDSLLGQTFQDWCLLVRDDGSSDATIKIVSEYLNKYPEKILFIDDKEKHLGACQSFAKLLEHSTGEYIMFCDQDDVWLENKVELTLEKMLDMEKQKPDKPILVHTDLKIADQNLNIISESMWRYQKLNPNRNRLNYLLVQNNVTGCTTMMNRKLKEAVDQIPQEAIIHDWWIALIASVFGAIGYVNQSTILYRQHGNNDIGAKKYSIKYLLHRFLNRKYAKEMFQKVSLQANSLLEVHSEKMDEEQRKILRSFSSLGKQTRFSRLTSIIRYSFMKTGFLRNFGFIAIVLTL